MRYQKLFLILILIVGVKQLSFSQDVYKPMENMVDPVTGDLNYAIPLMSVQGNNGENVPITIFYNSNIRVNDDASPIGLGWHMPVPQISRQVNGIPDDCNGKSRFELKQQPISNQIINNMGLTTRYGTLPAENSEKKINYGAFYSYNYDKNNPDHEMDVFASSIRNSSFMGLDYDDFSISAPGLKGNMKGYMFDYASVDVQPEDSEVEYNEIVSEYDNDNHFYGRFSRIKPVFRFDDDPNTIKTDNAFFEYGDGFSVHDFEYYYKSPVNHGAGLYSDISAHSNNFNSPKKYVEFFTNEEIDNYSEDEFLAMPEDHLTGETTVDRSDRDAIGGFRVTAENGLTYHFTLPIYKKDDYSHVFNKSSYTLNRFPDVIIAWKLVAITGPDYEDTDGNNKISRGDKGYYVSYKYVKWESGVQFSPAAGYRNGVYSKRYGINKRYSELQLNSSYGKNETEEYYLEKIETDKQVALFLKELRNDNLTKNINGNFYKPRYKEIALLNSKELDQLASNLDCSQVISDENIENSSSLNFIAYRDELINDLSPYILKSVNFDTDYNLCRRYYKNKHVTINGTGNIYTKTPVNVSTNENEYLNSGKLTLDKITIFNRNRTQTKPAYEFTYADNPDYKHYQTDNYESTLKTKIFKFA